MRSYAPLSYKARNCDGSSQCVTQKKKMGSKKVAESKNKGRRELQNLICSVNYDRR